MPSKARAAFDKNAADIEKLLSLQEQQGGTSRGRRYNLEVLNKSAIVLITAFWEAYCEELGTATFASTLRKAKKLLKEMIKLHLQTLEDVGEKERFFREHNIPLSITEEIHSLPE